MPEIEVSVSVYCSCGEGLCNQSSSGSNRNGAFITVEPCAKCLESAKEEGKKEGYDEGYSDKEQEIAREQAESPDIPEAERRG